MLSKQIGVMQSRLTPPRGRGIQFFPDGEGEWQKEFRYAQAAGVGHIQWVCNPDNPLFESATRAVVREIISQNGVSVHRMDIQFLTKRDVSSVQEDLIEKICMSVADIGGGGIEVPLMEASTLLDEAHCDTRIAALGRFIAAGERAGVAVAIETDLPPAKLADILDRMPTLSVVYDAGNSAGMGYDVDEEMSFYGSRISNVHIKDKPKGGQTVELGTGDVDFQRLFQRLSDLSYNGLITLQAARGEEGKEIETVKKQRAFVIQQYEKYF